MAWENAGRLTYCPIIPRKMLVVNLNSIKVIYISKYYEYSELYYSNKAKYQFGESICAYRTLFRSSKQKKCKIPP